MGSVISLFRRPKKILILGPAGAGKTTVLEHIALVNQVRPRLNTQKHFNFLKVRNYNVWDLATGVDLFQSWAYYYDHTACVIFIYDAMQPEESERILREISYTKELRNAAMLIIVNKYVEEGEMVKRLAKLMKRRLHHYVFVSQAQKLLNIRQGFEWITKNI